MARKTSRSAWQQREREAADLFGAKRQPGSGSGGREDLTRSDSTHDRLFIETKLMSSNATVSLFDETRKLAKLEAKIPVLMISKKFRPGFLVVVDSGDLGAILAEHAAAIEARGTTDAPDMVAGRDTLAFEPADDPKPAA